MQLSDVDLYDPDIYVQGVPHEMFATLRREAPDVPALSELFRELEFRQLQQSLPRAEADRRKDYRTILDAAGLVQANANSRDMLLYLPVKKNRPST